MPAIVRRLRIYARISHFKDLYGRKSSENFWGNNRNHERNHSSGRFKMIFLWLGMAGGIGAMGRFLIDRTLPPSMSFPISTFLINILGSLLIGFLFVVSSEKSLISKEFTLI